MCHGFVSSKLPFIDIWLSNPIGHYIMARRFREGEGGSRIGLERGRGREREVEREIK